VLAGGPHPDPYGEPAQLARVLDEFARNQIGAIVSLVELPLELPPERGFQYLHALTPDGEAPDDLEAICTFIDDAHRRGTGTFVHCHAGQGRTGTALAAYLIWSQGKRAWQAIDEVRATYHRLAVETNPQVTALEAFARRHRLL
jgi:atypical dual specificity phosphatase